MGYLHFFSAWNRCCSSLCNTSWLEEMVLALWYNVPTTQYFDGIVWWLSHCKYKSVCVWVFCTLKFGDCHLPWVLSGCLRRAWIHQFLFLCWKIVYWGSWNSSVPGSCSYVVSWWLRMCHPHIFFQSTEGEGDVLMAWNSRSSINRLATMGLVGDPIAAPSVCS